MSRRGLTRDQLVAALDDRVGRFIDGGDPGAVLDPQALVEARELAALGYDLEIAYTLGHLHHYRLVAGAPGDAEPDDAAIAVAHFAAVYRQAPDLVPEPLRDLIAQTVVPDAEDLRTWHIRAQALLRDPRRTPEPELISDAIYVLRQVIRSSEATDPHRAGYLSTLAIAHAERFERTGQLDDLDEAIRAAERCLDATLPDDPHRAGRRSNLAAALASRFAQTGVADDLDRAVAEFWRGVELATDEDRPGYLSNLGGALSLRFGHSGDTTSLDEAIDCCRRAVAATDDADRHRPRMLASLGITLRTRFQRIGRDVDIDEAIEAFRQAVDGMAPDHPDRATYLSGLGTALRTRFDARGRPADIDEAVQISRAAAQTPNHHEINRARYLSNLAAALSTRFRHRRDPTDLDDAVVAGREAERLAHQEDPVRATILANLGLALRLRTNYKAAAMTTAVNDAGEVRPALIEAAQVYASSAGTATAPPLVRATSAYEGGRIWVDLANWTAASSAFQLAVELLGSVTDHRLHRDDQQHHLSRLAGVGCEAAAVALEVGGPPARALALLEQGRAVLLARALATRTDTDALRERHPEPARRFDAVMDQLNRPFDEHVSVGTAARRHQLSVERDHILDEIRALPGFARFLLPPSSDDLISQAGPGHVVAVNISSYRCDALVASGSRISHVPLPDLTYSTARDQANALMLAVRENNWSTNDRLRYALGWLWETIAEPVLTHLGLTSPPAPGQPWPRIWWIPTGPLTVVPLHAAGHHDVPGEAVIDHAVSSYTPSILALGHARRGTSARDTRKPLIVGVPEAAGYRALPGAAAEATQVAHHLRTGQPPLLGARATRAAVMAALRDCSWAHFACHATTVDNPSDSHLVLHDGPLSVREISSLQVRGAHLAYLSACTTAFGGTDLVDESIHISSAFQLAEFTHVVGTLWPVDDAAAQLVADLTYASLPHASPAEAVHRTARHLRRRYPDNPLLWAAHLHAGP